jgi:hypothetical protein
MQQTISLDGVDQRIVDVFVRDGYLYFGGGGYGCVGGRCVILYREARKLSRFLEAHVDELTPTTKCTCTLSDDYGCFGCELPTIEIETLKGYDEDEDDEKVVIVKEQTILDQRRTKLLLLELNRKLLEEANHLNHPSSCSRPTSKLPSHSMELPL